MDNEIPSPIPSDAQQTTASNPLPTNDAPTPQTTSSLLAHATTAIDAVVAQTAQNPAERLKAVAKIKADYIRQQFGVDINQ